MRAILKRGPLLLAILLFAHASGIASTPAKKEKRQNIPLQYDKIINYVNRLAADYLLLKERNDAAERELEKERAARRRAERKLKEEQYIRWSRERNLARIRYSLFYPGLGQFLTGQKKRGIVWGLGFTASLFGYASARGAYARARRDYDNANAYSLGIAAAKSEPRVQYAYMRMSFSLFLTVAIYVANLIDAYQPDDDLLPIQIISLARSDSPVASVRSGSPATYLLSFSHVERINW